MTETLANGYSFKSVSDEGSLNIGRIKRSRSGCNIGGKTLFSERGKLPLKLTCPVSTSTYPATLLNKGDTLPTTLLAERGKSGYCSACPIAVFFAKFTYNKASGYVARCR